MKAQELRQFSVEELQTRIRQWREELFRAQLKKLSNEMKDTSIFKKLRQDIARALLVLGEKNSGKEIPVAPAAKKAEPAKADKAASKVKG